MDPNTCMYCRIVGGGIGARFVELRSNTRRLVAFHHPQLQTGRKVHIVLMPTEHIVPFQPQPIDAGIRMELFQNWMQLLKLLMDEHGQLDVHVHFEKPEKSEHLTVHIIVNEASP